MAESQSTKFLGVRVPLTMVDKMNEVMASEGFGITEYVKTLLREDLRRRGLLDGEGGGGGAPRSIRPVDASLEG